MTSSHGLNSIVSTKLSRTLKVKIGTLSVRKTEILDALLTKNNEAINLCLHKAKGGDRITHALVYKDLRNLDLPACVIHGCRAKSVEIIKSYKKQKGKQTLPQVKNCGVRFDNVVTKLRKTNNTLYTNFISILYKARKDKNNNRIELPLIVNSEYQSEIIKQIGKEYKLGSTELVKRGDNFFVHISYSKEVEIPEPDASFSPIGVDIGINNLAVSVAQSSVVFHSGQRIQWKNEFFRKQRALLQHNGAYQKLDAMRQRQTRYNTFYTHNIAKSIIEQAKKEIKPVIVMEDLTHILDTSKTRKNQRYKHHTWVFKRQQKAIEYKANWESIPVVYVDPYHSSQLHYKCGELNQRVGHTYNCKKCNETLNADYNAGRNLQQFFLAKCQREQASINNAFNCAIPEPKAEKDSLVDNNSIEVNLWKK